MSSRRRLAIVLADGRWSALVTSWLLLAPACVGESSRGEEASREAIVGGDVESGYPLVGALAVVVVGHGSEAFCTATAVTPTVLLTAAHCLDAFEDLAGYALVFHQTFADGTDATTAVVPASRVTHPDWTGHIGSGTYADVGLVRLEEPVDGALFPRLERTEISAGDIGTRLLAVGFGITSDDADDAGVKRSVDVEVSRVMSRAFGIVGYPDDAWGTCNGDSGGPSFLVEEDRDVQWGVHARGSAMTCGPGEETAVGAFFDDFIGPTILAMDGTAADCGDGRCTGLEDVGDCVADCAVYECGDGHPEPPEVCDDGNTEGGDGCAADCGSDESCGNGVLDVEAGEVCDDGNAEGGDGCSSTCTLPRADEGGCGCGAATGRAPSAVVALVLEMLE
jgi:cysteine-rich repeat protein